MFQIYLIFLSSITAKHYLMEIRGYIMKPCDEVVLLLLSCCEGSKTEDQSMKELETERGQEYGQDYMVNTSLPVVCWHGINSNAQRWSNTTSLSCCGEIYLFHCKL